ncbi:hypothetical protein GYMLUDRAFT_253531 [Collybiopsis luxurians FD-317 M1]|uniref:Uncharacterized protein n=1 Tax=Collybiopsis luxurians FD-317 M1 TaxID=944289 RepID=A0A0D0AI65_9AGAR|nr:hypothetical protein GYMLUDRAFT_253531 [Collybiopsis luxurians FD-317 M1]
MPANTINDDNNGLEFVSLGLRNLLHSLAGNPLVPPAELDPASDNAEESVFPDFFNLAEGLPPAELRLDPRAEGTAKIAQAILQRFDDLAIMNSDDEDEEMRSCDGDDPSPSDGEVGDYDTSDFPQKRARTVDKEATSQHWYPWQDRITCTLDILMHLPRSVFSQKQLDLFLWLLKVNGVSDVPSVKTMKSLNAALQKMCGIDSLCYKGALGNIYYVNSMAQIIAQEMANPKVRPKLHFYPEDSGNFLSEARQAERWLKEAPDNLLTPMALASFASQYDGSAAKILSSHSAGNLSQSSPMIKMNFVELGAEAESMYHVPHPSKIFDVFDPVDQSHSVWMFTNANEGNKWRKLAGGHCVVSFPIWMYCDDTSGNVSKKWNEHNSFLFTAAGLPRAESSKEYNVHFLCTSNTALPLEMLDGIIDQLEHVLAQEHGIWAWDCELNEPVLVEPWVLALLGDNPMQSEFAAHIGLRGKYFCRVCWVKGSDTKQPILTPDNPEGSASDISIQSEGHTGSASVLESAVSSDAASQASPKKAKKFMELFSQMLDRVSAFVKAGNPRNKAESMNQLRSYFEDAKKLHTKTKVKENHTSSGIKDTFQEYFLHRLFNSYAKKRTTESKQAALDDEIRRLPENIYSPVWRIKGLDPHQDTPVEILHVILLGFLKYMWRDMIQNQLKLHQDFKDLLMMRLNNFNVDGLEVSPLAGRTLVQYAGSLTGCDFRIIAQTVPFVIHDFKVSSNCRETWLALCRLVPLIWQPQIENKTLEHEIDYFLLCAARWTARWFNKPKFHIFTHLPMHIRQFGPAMLFATEAFESFNAVIRAKRESCSTSSELRFIFPSSNNH